MAYIITSSYSLDDEKYENEHLLQSDLSDPGQIVRAVYDVEEATSTAFDIILEHKVMQMINSDTRASLIKFLQLMVAHHPSRRCRKGTADILVNFDDSYPSDILSANKKELAIGSGKSGLQNFQICGKEVPRGYWALSSDSLTIKILLCSVSSPFSKSRDFVLWLWSAHNKVNERLMKEEAALGTGDPKFPKIIWPSKQLCPSCHLTQSRKNGGDSQSDWDHDEVFKFLASYYGKMLVTLSKDKELLEDGGDDKTPAEDLGTSTNPLVVPLGAALAIAVASCAFGALACYWRSQQKNRNHLDHLLDPCFHFHSAVAKSSAGVP
ncbi:hypothetical protein RJ639_043572 [Escallonia herrerae]|uniref:Sulfhydryl oxidase n=1 Tax=Escallonia herrerae TaxID=1293975 RepID=A0AA88WEE3_9ASTE|nr:hypothetical protein RJ639_043572 [Escallonia herrerae]